LFVTKDEPERRERKHSERLPGGFARWRRRVVPLAHEDERRSLAERLSVAPFARGEVIVRQGVEAHHLYIMVSGAATVRVATAEVTSVRRSERFTKATFSARWA